MAKIYHAHLWGSREDKYRYLLENDVNTVEWTEVNPEPPFYLFIPQNTDLFSEYEQYFKITDIMPVNVLGFQTHRDDFSIDFDREELHKRIAEMLDQNISDEKYYQKYNIKDSRDWKLREARQNLQNDSAWEDKLITCLYRPFDWRYCYYSTVAMDYPRRELINHVAGKENLCLGLGRQGIAVNDLMWYLIQVSNKPIDANVFRRGGINVFPLYLYPETDKPKELQQEKRPNFSPDFLKSLESKLGYIPTPEAIFYYIYAIFHSPTYRQRYGEFLKIDFPRVPLTSNQQLFQDLGEKGQELVELHLMQSPKLNKFITKIGGGGDNAVTEVTYKPTEERVYIKIGRAHV